MAADFSVVCDYHIRIVDTGFLVRVTTTSAKHLAAISVVHRSRSFSADDGITTHIDIGISIVHGSLVWRCITIHCTICTTTNPAVHRAACDNDFAATVCRSCCCTTNKAALDRATFHTN